MLPTSRALWALGLVSVTFVAGLGGAHGMAILGAVLDLVVLGLVVDDAAHLVAVHEHVDLTPHVRHRVHPRQRPPPTRRCATVELDDQLAGSSVYVSPFCSGRRGFRFCSLATRFRPRGTMY